MLKQCPATVCLGQIHFSEQQDLPALLLGQRWDLTVAQSGVGLSLRATQGWSGLCRGAAPAEAGHGSPCSVWQGVLDAEGGRWQEPMSYAGSDLRSKAIGVRFPSLQP